MSAILWWPEVYRAFDLSVPVSVGAGVSGVVSGAADFGLDVPVGVGMAGAAISSGEFDLAVPISVGMFGPTFTDLSVPVGIGMAGVEEYSAVMGLHVPVDIGVEGVLSGGPFGLEVPVNIGMAGHPYFRDDFNRPNSTVSLGGDWIVKAGSMGIRSNAAYPLSAQICSAMYPDPLTSDDMEVSMVVGNYAGDALTGARPSYLILGADEAVGAAAWLRVDRSSGNLLIYTVNDWARESFTTRATIAHGGIASGDEFTLRRVGNIYTVLKDGNEIGAWIDENDALPRDANHRFVGVGGWGGGPNANYQLIDHFTAQAL